MEEEARIILREAVDGGKAGPGGLARFTRECFASLGGVELELPPRGPMREPPDFSSAGALTSTTLRAGVWPLRGRLASPAAQHRG